MWGFICVVYKVQFMVIFISLLWNFAPYIQLATKKVLHESGMALEVILFQPHNNIIRNGCWIYPGPECNITVGLCKIKKKFNLENYTPGFVYITVRPEWTKIYLFILFL